MRELEQAAASILGQMLFEFSRLDVALGLFLVWSGEGRQLEELTKKVADYSFNKKLDYLKELVDGKFAENPQAYSSYTQWLEDADTKRITRNDLVHGRWGTDERQQQVINVVGLPTSPGQREIRYSIKNLEDVVEDIKRLQIRLQEFKNRWPL